MSINPNIKLILEKLSASRENDLYAEDKGPLISVNKLAGKAGALYEKMRYLVDYKEEHTIRRSAIERILKRKLLLGKGDQLGLALLRELVGSGYLPNDKISESAAKDIQTIIDKYLLLSAGNRIENSRIIGLAASEIERFLSPQLLNDLVADCFYQTVFDQIKLAEGTPLENLPIQTYIACRRALLEDDQDALFYAVLVRYLPDLPALRDENEVDGLSAGFLETIETADKELASPLSWQILPKLKSYSVCFSIIKEIIKKYGVVAEAVFADQARLEEEVKKILAEKYKQQRAVAGKSGTRAVIYILLTKIILALILELPYEKIFLASGINELALSVNIIFHPLLLLLMVKTISSPSAENTKAIVASIQAIARNESVKPIYLKSSTDGVVLKAIFGLFYAILSLVSFGLILWALNFLGFNVVSIILFLFFLTLVSYFGFRIRYNAKKWTVPTKNEGALNLLWNFFTIPIVRTGRWLSRRFASINIFVFVMDFILETPFKFILGTFDSFISFLREKTEGPY